MYKHNQYNEDTFYKIVKLKTGETILCTMNNDIRSLASETHLQLTTPVQVIPHQESRRNGQVVGESFVLRPWIGLSDSDEFTISADIVLTIGSLKKEVRQQYVNYIEHTNETQKRHEDQVEREEAAVNLLREITPGELYFIDEPLNTENDHDNNQE
jgi:hypothetical protein